MRWALLTGVQTCALPICEKFRRILESYQIEVDYGRTLGVERIDIDGSSMDVLRVGRIGLYALTPDGSSPKMWDVQTHEWNALSRGKAASIREGLKMARELTDRKSTRLNSSH